MAAACSADPPVSVSAVAVRMDAQRASWRASYVLQQAHGHLPAVIETGREVHVPVGADVTIVLASHEYVAGFTAAGIGLHDFAAPGLPGEFHFHADRPGRYDVQGAEMCGLPHGDATRGWLVVEDPAAFRAWVRRRTRTPEA